MTGRVDLATSLIFIPVSSVLCLYWQAISNGLTWIYAVQNKMFSESRETSQDLAFRCPMFNPVVSQFLRCFPVFRLARERADLIGGIVVVKKYYRILKKARSSGRTGSFGVELLDNSPQVNAFTRHFFF